MEPLRPLAMAHLWAAGSPAETDAMTSPGIPTVSPRTKALLSRYFIQEIEKLGKRYFTPRFYNEWPSKHDSHRIDSSIPFTPRLLTTLDRAFIIP